MGGRVLNLFDLDLADRRRNLRIGMMDLNAESEKGGRPKRNTKVDLTRFERVFFMETPLFHVKKIQ